MEMADLSKEPTESMLQYVGRAEALAGKIELTGKPFPDVLSFVLKGLWVQCGSAVECCYPETALSTWSMLTSLHESPGKPKLLEKATARRTAHRVMAKKKRKGSDKKQKGVLRGCKKTRRKLREHLRLRAEIHSQLRVIASLLVLRIFPTCLLKDFCKFFANPNFKTCYNQLQRRLVRNRHPMLMPVFEDPSNQALLAKLQGLGSINLAGDANTIDAHSMQLAMCEWLQLEEDMAEVSMERHGHAKQLVVFFGAAGIVTAGGWGAGAVLRACRKVVCRPRGTDQQRGRVVLVDEHRTTRVRSAVNGKQPCEVELNTLSATRPAGWKPPAGQVEQRLVRPAWSQQRDQPVRGLLWCPVVAPRKPPQVPRSSQEATPAAASEPGPSTPPPAKRSKRTKAEPAAKPTKGKGKGKAAKAKPAPQPGRWLDRDCNAALNMQRIGESMWRPLELCYWPDQGALPAKGKEYPGLGYKRLLDKPPKAQQQQQQQPAEAQ
ncbi:hypothetical protein QJQ45_028682 [Haematococcus lacustris]|nr:hypothetical protein QJQ45_028682 [Haematococcus lacustris]